MGATVNGSLDFDSMTNDLASTVLTAGSKSRDCTFKTVKHMRLVSHDHLKGLIVFIAADFTLGHAQHSFLSQAFLLLFLPP